MKRSWRLWLSLLLLLLLGSLLLVPSIRWPIYGWLRGEAFYQGMPVSWWAKEVAKLEPLYIDRWYPELELSRLPTSWLDELSGKLGFGGVKSREDLPGWRVLYHYDWESLPFATFDSDRIELARDMLDDPNPFVRWSALRALMNGNIYEVSILTKAIHDEDLDVRLNAAFGLVVLHRRGDVHSIEEQPVVPVLVEGIRHNSSWARLYSVMSLGELGLKAKTALPVLIKVWKEGNSREFGRHLTDAIEGIDPEAAAKVGVK